MAGSLPTADDGYVGWTPSPQGRGTWDILQACLITITLAVWTSVIPQIPRRHCPIWVRYHRKFELAALGLLGPEFVMVMAAGQLSSALRSKQDFKKAGYDGWSLRHAFFADMGGFVLQCPDTEEPFAVDAKQLLWLIQHKYIQRPELETEDIDAKSQVDRVSRLFTVIQGLWFTINMICRAAQNLTITNLEITTLTFMLMMFFTSILWWQKPAQVESSVPVDSQTPLKVILAKEGRSLDEYYRWTPLDFISREEFSVSVGWGYYTQVLANMHLRISFQTDHVKPRRDITDKYLRVTHMWLELVGTVVFISFFGMYIIPWNFPYPTPIEKLLWRIGSTFFAVSGLLAYFWCLYYSFRDIHRELTPVLPGPDSDRGAVWYKSRRAARAKIHAIANGLRNITPEQDPQMTVPLHFILPPTVFAVGHCICRLFIIVEDFVQLRSLPANAYQTVNWSVYFPHW